MAACRCRHNFYGGCKSVNFLGVEQMKVNAGEGLSEDLILEDAEMVAPLPANVSPTKTNEKLRKNGSEKLPSTALLGNNNEVLIQHQNETYILRLTKQNKLILTK